MSAAVLPNQHYRTPLDKRMRIVSVKGPLVSATYTSPGGIDYVGEGEKLVLSLDFVQRHCRPVLACAVAAAVGAEA